jgi:hypothetical protein
MITYKNGSELPNIEFTWNDSDGALRDFSAGWDFVVRVGTPGAEALIEKTEGITGDDVVPNVLIEWDADELDILPLGNYSVEVEATLISTGQSIIQGTEISKTASILPLVP